MGRDAVKLKFHFLAKNWDLEKTLVWSSYSLDHGPNKDGVSLTGEGLKWFKNENIKMDNGDSNSRLQWGSEIRPFEIQKTFKILTFWRLDFKWLDFNWSQPFENGKKWKIKSRLFNIKITFLFKLKTVFAKRTILKPEKDWPFEILTCPDSRFPLYSDIWTAETSLDVKFLVTTRTFPWKKTLTS